MAAAVGQQLQELGLPGCRGVGDEGVAALAAMTNLRKLNLSSNRELSGRYVYVCGGGGGFGGGASFYTRAFGLTGEGVGIRWKGLIGLLGAGMRVMGVWQHWR